MCCSNFISNPIKKVDRLKESFFKKLDQTENSRNDFKEMKFNLSYFDDPNFVVLQESEIFLGDKYDSFKEFDSKKSTEKNVNKSNDLNSFMKLIATSNDNEAFLRNPNQKLIKMSSNFE